MFTVSQQSILKGVVQARSAGPSSGWAEQLQNPDQAVATVGLNITIESSAGLTSLPACCLHRHYLEQSLCNSSLGICVLGMTMRLHSVQAATFIEVQTNMYADVTSGLHTGPDAVQRPPTTFSLLLHFKGTDHDTGLQLQVRTCVGWCMRVTIRRWR